MGRGENRRNGRKGTSSRGLAFSAFVLISASTTLAEDQGTNEGSTNTNILSLRNPFEPQFPQKSKPPIDIPVMQPKNNSIPKPAPAITESKPAPILPEIKFDPSQFQVNGVVWDTKRPQAIINNQVVNIGDVVNGAQIVSIQKTGIDFAMNKKIYTIKP